MTYEYCAKIEDGVVVWIVRSDSVDWCNENLSGDWLPVYDYNYCGVGWTWDGTSFIAPPPETES